MPIIKIKPLDTLFFRDGKPFSMGEDTYAESIFPPPPSVFYGALRTAYFAENPNDLHLANTPNDPTKDLEITGIFYNLQNDLNDLWLPIPFDLLKLKEKKIVGNKCETIFLSQSNAKIISSSPFENLLNDSNKRVIENISNGFLHQLAFIDYLEGRKANIKANVLNKIIEYKIGIGRNNLTLLSKDSLLYRLGMLRFDYLKIFVEYDFKNNYQLKEGVLKLGAEGKTAFYKSEDKIKKFDFHKEIPKNNEKFKLYLATPAIFKKGWLPDWIDENTLRGKGLKLVNAVIGKSINIGGFDMKVKKPKFMRKAVPAGSVYFFEKENNNIEIEKIFNSYSICDDFQDINYKQQGFGIYYFAKI